MGSGYEKWIFALFFCYAVGGAVPGHAQEGFEADAISVRGEESGKTRLDLYTRIPYSKLGFQNSSEGFTASYEVQAEVHLLDDRDRPTTMVESSIWEHTAMAPAFALTKSDQQFDLTTHALELVPARYLVTFQIRDRHSQQNYVRELPVVVRDLEGPLALSDIVLLKEYDEESRTIHPHLSNELGANLLTFDIFYEIYADTPRQVTVRREVAPIRKDRSTFVRVSRTLLGLTDNPTRSAVLFSDEETTDFAAGRHQIVSRIPLTELDMGDYVVRVTLEEPEGQVLAVSERTFSARWTGLATHLSNLDQAIEQLVYCAKIRDINSIRNAPSREERLRLFQDFWRKRDPTPGTGRNERMEEYYYRIDYANRKFGSFTPGWKTDRGQVLIMHGYPDDTRRQTFSFDNEPWEIWYYYRIGRQFIFIDKTGFGDYELIVPIWDERTRIR